MSIARKASADQLLVDRFGVPNNVAVTPALLYGYRLRTSLLVRQPHVVEPLDVATLGDRARHWLGALPGGVIAAADVNIAGGHRNVRRALAPIRPPRVWRCRGCRASHRRASRATFDILHDGASVTDVARRYGVARRTNGSARSA